FLTLPDAPMSTIFPYTTLFRSLLTWKKKAPKNFQNVSMFAMWLVPFGLAVYNNWWRFIGIWSVMSLITASLISKPLTNKHIHGRDRKSTRLNSSHVEISYAVFC